MILGSWVCGTLANPAQIDNPFLFRKLWKLKLHTFGFQPHRLGKSCTDKATPWRLMRTELRNDPHGHA